VQHAVKEAGAQPLRPGLFAPESRFTSFNIGLRTVHRTPAAIECSTTPLPAAAACFAMATFTQPDVYPAKENLPSQHGSLLDWYRDWNQGRVEDRIENDPLLALRGSGQELWTDEHADETYAGWAKAGNEPRLETNLVIDLGEDYGLHVPGIHFIVPLERVPI
jgi:hypothetical protein